MGKKSVFIALLAGILAIAGFTGAGVYKSVSSVEKLTDSGYVLQTGTIDAADKQLSFNADTSYRVNKLGTVSLKSSSGQRVSVDSESFVFYEDGSVAALSDGILLDFNDLSENFINNYYISAGVRIQRSGDSYITQMASSDNSFGENIWKLSDSKYLIQSPKLYVYFSESDIRETEDFVCISEDDSGIVEISTKDNNWITLSESLYVKTANGNLIYPGTQIIQDDNYKISLAKLSVTPDECIVLTEDETRRQIVPEIKIETIDGEDGTDGTAGQNGANGIDGLIGEDGEAGEDGKDGKAGEDGKDGIDGVDGKAGADGSDGKAGYDGADGMAGSNGADGVAGSDGADGASGSNGADGKSGADGTDGEKGDSGKDGTDGSSGSDGTDGTDGTDGSNGGTGYRGAKGDSGASAISESSVNSAIPSMSFVEWNVSATSLDGTILISDESGYLSNMQSYNQSISTGSALYPSVVIYNTETNEAYTCVEPKLQPPDVNFTSFYQGDGVKVNFALDSGLNLEPDTQYRISVSSYYLADDNVYYREFISRVFYTDSSGVYLSHYSSDIVTTATSAAGVLANAKLTVNVKVAEKYRQNSGGDTEITKAEVYILTEAQAKNFSYAARDNSGSYTARKTLNYGTGNSDAYEQNITFDGLSSNTSYVARVVVSMSSDGGSSSMSLLTKQSLAMKTLKIPPTWTGSSQVFFNRSTGAFEIYRPQVTDQDGGAVKYIYTPIVKGVENADKAKEIDADAKEPVSFWPTSQDDYQFRISMEFYDNEKTVVYDLGTSDAVQAVGSSLPKVWLDTNDTHYDSMSGTVMVQLDDITTNLKVDDSHPLQFVISADGIRTQVVKITNLGSYGSPAVYTDLNNGTFTDPTYYTYELSLEPSQSSTNYISISTKLNHLYYNTKYTITLKGYLDVLDGNGNIERELGYCSFRTLAPSLITAKWSSAPSTFSSYGFAQTLCLAVSNSDAEEQSYTEENLKDGEVQLQLCASNGTVISTQSVTDENDLAALYGAGLTITEDTLKTSVNAKESYILRVKNVVDVTYDTELNTVLGYENDFGTPSNSTISLESNPTPPDLTDEPNKYISVTPILNNSAMQAKYGIDKNDNYPEDTVIGYVLQADYDNNQRMAISCNYYCMEYKSYYSALTGYTESGGVSGFDGSKIDPLSLSGTGGIQKLWAISEDFADGSDSAPAIAVFFGNSPANTVGSYQTLTGVNVYYAGKLTDDGAGNYTSGMERGLDYVFACTVTYRKGGKSGTGAIETYPYGSSQYASCMVQYGCGTEYGKSIGMNVAYILNSGMVSAPKVSPNFFVIPQETVSQSLYGGDNSTLTHGILRILYSFTDPDNVISSATAINYTVPEGMKKLDGTDAGADETDQVSITNKLVSGYSDWYEFNMPYSMNLGETKLLEPKVNLNNYRLDYNLMLQAMTENTVYAGTVNETVRTMCSLPVDWAWGAYFGRSANKSKISYSAKLDTASNDIEFTLVCSDSSFLTEIYNRAYGVKITASAAGISSKSVVVPIEVGYNVGSYYYASVATSDLGDQFTGKDISFELSILYDSGAQGFKFASQFADRWGLQYTSDTDYNMGLGLYKNPKGTSTSPSYGYLKFNSAVASDGEGAFANGLLAVDKLDSEWIYHRGFSSEMMSVNASVSARPAQNGVLDSDRYFTIKGVGSYALSKSSGSGGGGISFDSITPTIKLYANSERAATKFKSASFTVSGFTSADSPVVYVGLFNTEADAKALTGAVITKTIDIDSTSGNSPDSETHESEYIFDGLTLDRDYYLAYYMKVKGADTLLLNSGTKNYAIVSFSTTDTLNITVSSCIYNNSDYFNKNLTVIYALSRTYGVSVDYAIYSGLDASRISAIEAAKTQAEIDAQAAPVLSGTSMAAIIASQPGSLTTTKNTLTLNLEPDSGRSVLTPGGKYYLLISAKEGGNLVGCKFAEFTLPSIGDIGAYIFVSNADDDSVTFEVTISDDAYSVMGFKQSAGTSESLYTVRFTDAHGNRIPTSYDSEVYSVSELRKVFTLDNSKIVTAGKKSWTITAGETYCLNIYAAIDPLHDGQSYPVNSSGEKKSWKYFFTDGVNTAVKAISNFIDFISSFWTDGTYNGEDMLVPDPAMDSIASKFLVSSRYQSTVAQDNVLINMDTAVIFRNGAAFQLQMPESFGFIKSDSSQYFKRVDFSISGYTDSGVRISRSGSSLVSNGDTIFTSVTDNAGYNMFVYDINQYTISKGRYNVTVQLYINEGDSAPAYSISGICN